MYISVCPLPMCFNHFFFKLQQNSNVTLHLCPKKAISGEIFKTKSKKFPQQIISQWFGSQQIEPICFLKLFVQGNVDKFKLMVFLLWDCYPAQFHILYIAIFSILSSICIGTAWQNLSDLTLEALPDQPAKPGSLCLFSCPEQL